MFRARIPRRPVVRFVLVSPMSMFLDLLEAVSLSAVGLCAFAWLRTEFNLTDRRVLDFLLGLTFGVAAVVSILGGFSPMTGIILDGRTVMLTVAGLFGGPIGGATSAVLAGLCRIHVGGAETLSALVAIGAVAAMAALCGLYVRSSGGVIGVRHLAAAGLMAAAFRSFSVMLLRDERMADKAFDIIAVPMAAAVFLGVVIIGMLTLFEFRRTQLEHMLSESIAQANMARAEAEAANRAKSEFLARMSHEFRTPLNAILGFSEIMERETFGVHSHPKYREYATLIWQGGHHLLQVISDILDLARIEAGGLVMQEENVGIADLVHTALDLVSATAAEAGVNLTSTIDDEPLNLRGDARRLNQVLLNVLSNAIKFTPPGGSITISCGRSGSGEVVLTVRDTGIGIRPEDLAMLFRPFSQIGGAFVRRTEGAGLGLVISRSIVEAHGGTFALESAPGCGTAAIITMPATPKTSDLLIVAA